jgi:transcriptional regulator with XRE-family HTH domain
VIAPDRVFAVRYAKGLRRQELARKSLPCQLTEAEEASASPVLQTLQVLLADLGGNADAELLISNHLVRYLLVPSQPDLNTADEEARFVRFCFAETYGDKDVTKWSLRCGDSVALDAQVASAIDQELLDGLLKVCTGARVNVTSIQPYLMTAFNHFRQDFPDASQWIALAEPGRLCLGMVDAGSWKHLRSVRLGAQWANELPVILEREMQVAGRFKAGGKLLLILPAALDLARLPLPGFSIRMVVTTPEDLIRGTVQPVASLEARA